MEENNLLRQGGPDASERRTDHDLVGRAGKFLERYKIFWLIITGIVVWWGKTVVIPLQESAKTTAEVKMINMKLDSVLIPRLEYADADRVRMIRIQEIQTEQLGVLTRLQCLKTSYIDRAKISLSCKDIPIEIVQ